jgi:gluconolactonase
MNPSIKIYDDSARQFLNLDFEIETLADDCKFTEGPLWNKEGFYLFSDTTANAVIKIAPGQKGEIYIGNSGTANENDEDLKPGQAGSNALAYDTEGNLLVCRHGSHEIAKWNGKELQPYISFYNGRPFNSPNDQIVDKKGRVFFSDPPYGLKEGKLNPEKFQPIAGAYCFEAGDAGLFCNKYQYPNGVCLTPDESELYICSNKPFEKFICVYDTDTLQFKRILAEENSDGIKCDPQGNVYLCNKDGIIVLNREGKRLALIQFSTIPANCCWGGEAKKDLFICARENVFLIKNLLR